MTRTEKYFGLSLSRVEGDAREVDYRQALDTAIDLYSIGDNAWDNDKDGVIVGAMRLLNGYDVDPAFALEPERGLFVLAIADTWLSTKSIAEKKSLLDILKLVVTENREDERNGSLSGKVRVWTEQGNPRGTLYDPEAVIGNVNSEYLIMLSKYIEDNTDKTATEEVSRHFSDWGEGSILCHVRRNLEISRQEEELPFDAVVLSKTEKQMRTDVGFSSLFMETSLESVIVLNSEYKKYDSLEHEYAHSQGGLNKWFHKLLFRGINEALTEEATINPHFYIRQRKFLREILDKHPEYKTMLYDAYAGIEGSRVEIFSRIVNDYGLMGFLVFSRVSPLDNPLLSGNIGQSVFIDSREVLALLNARVTSNRRK